MKLLPDLVCLVSALYVLCLAICILTKMSVENRTLTSSTKMRKIPSHIRSGVLRTKKVTKVKVTVDEVEANESWKESVKSLKAHIHRKRVQADSLNSAKESLEEDEILMQVDYSESYKNAEQDEIQSAYFGHTCFSLFAACIYYWDKQELLKIPITVTTESSEHSRIA